MFDIAAVPTAESTAEFHRVFTALEQFPRTVIEALAVPLIDFVREEGIAELFEQEGIPPWRPLALPTVKQRIRLGFPGSHPILVRTGSLRASLTARGHPYGIEVVEHRGGDMSIVLGSTDPRFGVLHAGSDRIPARPMLPEGSFMVVLMTRAETDIIVHRFDEAIKGG